MSAVTSVLKLDYIGVQLNGELGSNVRNLAGFSSSIFRGGLDTSSTEYTDTKENFKKAYIDVQKNLKAIYNLVEGVDPVPDPVPQI
mgnify:CR=1 FL=1